MASRYLLHRPHRIRLLKEIKRRKKTRGSDITGEREKRGTTVTGTWATNEKIGNSRVHQAYSPTENLDIPERFAPSAPGQKSKPEDVPNHPTKEKRKKTGQVSEIDQTDEVADSSSTSTACTPYEELASPAMELTPLALGCAATPREGGDSLHPLPSERNNGEAEGSLSTGMKVSEPSKGIGVGNFAHLQQGQQLSSRETATAEYKSRTRLASTDGEGLTHVVQKSDASGGRSAAIPSLKGTLQMSGVKTGNMKIALPGNEPFLQVKACDQLRRTNAVEGKGDSTAKNLRGKMLCP